MVARDGCRAAELLDLVERPGDRRIGIDQLGGEAPGVRGLTQQNGRLAGRRVGRLAHQIVGEPVGAGSGADRFELGRAERAPVVDEVGQQPIGRAAGEVGNVRVVSIERCARRAHRLAGAGQRRATEPQESARRVQRPRAAA